MARTFPGALVPAVNPDGSVQWQSWQYEELLAHLDQDLQLDSSAVDFSGLRVPIGSWIPLTPIATWANVGGGTTPFGMLKDPLGFVHLRGRLSVGANGSNVVVFPSGFAPAAAQDFYAIAGYTGAVASAAFVSISAGGAAAIFYAAGTTQVALGGMSFLAET